MKTWHPITKVAVAVGLLAVPVLLLTDDAAQPPAGPAAPGAARGLGTPSTPDADSASAVPAMADLALLPPSDTFNAVVERPLFSPNRRAAAAEEPVVIDVFYEPAPDEPQEPRVSFVGTVRRGDEVMALISNEDSGDIETLSIGSEVQGWQVLSVDDRALELGQAGERLELKILAGRRDEEGTALGGQPSGDGPPEGWGPEGGGEVTYDEEGWDEEEWSDEESWPDEEGWAEEDEWPIGGGQG